MTNREKNLQKLLDRLPKDVRIESAVRHVDALKTMPVPEVKQAMLKKSTYDTMFWSFLEGWDAAMELRFEEMQDENRELHSRIFDYEMDKIKHEAAPRQPSHNQERSAE